MSFLGKLIYGVFSSKDQIEAYQIRIRDTEWNDIKAHIPEKSKFLDVGCGAGYSMFRAKKDLQCDCLGIDPNPKEHGVGRFTKEDYLSDKIIQGFSEALPFEDETFDVVYSSHVLEHVIDKKETLREMNRVLKRDGVLILGMPTASMAWINLFSSLFFTTHVKIYEFLRGLFKRGSGERLKAIFTVRSHSYPNKKYVFSDLMDYRISTWRKQVKSAFTINTELTPAFYPFPDFIQFFPIHKNKLFSSSIFFICSKKESTDNTTP